MIEVWISNYDCKLEAYPRRVIRLKACSEWMKKSFSDVEMGKVSMLQTLKGWH